MVFHAGTKKVINDIVTDGGRVFAVSAYAPTLNEALEAVYAGVEEVAFEGKTFRRDIAHRCAFFFIQVILLKIEQSINPDSCKTWWSDIRSSRGFR